MEAFEGAREGGNVRKVTHFGEFADAVTVGREEFGCKFHAGFKDKFIERNSGKFKKKFPQIDLRNVAFGGKSCGGKIFKGVGEDTVCELTEFKIILLRGNLFTFTGKTEIDELFYLDNCPGMVKFCGTDIFENTFKQTLYFSGAFRKGRHLSVGKSFQKSVVDSASSFAVKINPDMAVGFGVAAVIKTVKTVAVSGADDCRGLQMQKRIIKFQINGT